MDNSEDNKTRTWSCAKCGSMIIPGDKECKDCGRFSCYLIGQIIEDLHSIIFEGKDVPSRVKFDQEGSFITNCGRCHSIHFYAKNPCPVCRKHRAKIFLKTFFRLILASIFPRMKGDAR